MKKTKEQAFSLVEILVALIAVSCISAALAPVITKKLKSNGISIGGGGIGGGSGGGGGGFGSDVSTNCSALNPSGKCIMCNKDATICYTCTEACAENEYRNDGTCSCHVCADFHDKCIRCGATGCSGCTGGYGLLSGGGCEQCGDGKYVNMEGYCATCPEGYYCKDGEKTTCPLGSFSTGGTSECRNCSEIAQNCVECTENGCTKCKVGYKLEGGNFCKPASSVKTFITPGNHTFQVPDTTTEITVTLVSGGAGGGAGSMKQKTHTVVISGNGNMTANADNFVSTTSTGAYTWTVPQAVKNRNFKFTACGGGGGGGGSGGEACGAGGTGGYVQNAVAKTSESSLTVQIGGYGGHGASNNSGIGASGGCAFGGGGGSSYDEWGSGNASSCGSSGSWGKGGSGNDYQWANGYGGYDPLYGSHGSGGASGGTYYTTGGKGSYLGGGGGGGGRKSQGGGGGGAPTLFRHTSFAKTAKYVAGGGGGGASMRASDDDEGGGGGGGGGISGGTGGTNGSWNGKDGSNAVTGAYTIFGGSYCNGGGCGGNGKNGAMRIFYLDGGDTGGRGGGAGQIVPEQTISVTPGETLIVTVGSGGAGGKVSYYDSVGTTVAAIKAGGADENIVSKITKADGIILLTTATSVSQAGATGGEADGSSGGKAGFITNGRNLKPIAMAGYSNTDGSSTTTKTGGIGGKTVLEEGEGHCSAGAGSDVGIKGLDATGYGGCGGGGGGAGADGGAGAGGYVMIRYVE